MHEVHPNLLWVGHALDLREPRDLFDLRIGAVVDLAFEESPANLPRQLMYLRFPIVDGEGNDPNVMLQAVQNTVDCLASATPTLVACSAGMSRSPTVAAHALAHHSGESAETVISRISESKPLEINATLWNDVASIVSRLR